MTKSSNNWPNTDEIHLDRRYIFGVIVSNDKGKFRHMYIIFQLKMEDDSVRELASSRYSTYGGTSYYGSQTYRSGDGERSSDAKDQ